MAPLFIVLNVILADLESAMHQGAVSVLCSRKEEM